MSEMDELKERVRILEVQVADLKKEVRALDTRTQGSIVYGGPR